MGIELEGHDCVDLVDRSEAGPVASGARGRKGDRSGAARSWAANHEASATLTLEASSDRDGMEWWGDSWSCHRTSCNCLGCRPDRGLEGLCRRIDYCSGRCVEVDNGNRGIVAHDEPFHPGEHEAVSTKNFVGVL